MAQQLCKLQAAPANLVTEVIQTRLSITVMEARPLLPAGTFDNGIYPDLGVHVPNVNGVFGDIPAPARSASFDRISVGIMSRQLVGNFHSPLDGYVSEVLIFNKVLSEAELNEVGYYLEQKYSLTTEYKATAGYSIETDGSTLVREKNATSDTFDVVLATAPTSAVTVTVQPRTE